MIKKKARLPRGAFETGPWKSVSTPYFSLKQKNNTTGTRRIGVVASKTFHKSAAKRNFWKRQAKAALVKTEAVGKDLLIVLFPRTTTLTRKKFQNIVQQAEARLFG